MAEMESSADSISTGNNAELALLEQHLENKTKVALQAVAAEKEEQAQNARAAVAFKHGGRKTISFGKARNQGLAVNAGRTEEQTAEERERHLEDQKRKHVKDCFLRDIAAMNQARGEVWGIRAVVQK